MNGKNKYNKGIWAEDLVKEKLSWKVGRKVIRHTNYDEDGNESWQCVVVNGKKYICPDLEVYEKELEMRVEVKSFEDFPKNIPFEAKGKVLVISKKQLDRYFLLQKDEEIPVFVVFVVADGFGGNSFYWASVEDMITRFPARESLYEWTFDGRKEVCYFFRTIDFRQDIESL